jgi:hypothetical protein
MEGATHMRTEDIEPKVHELWHFTEMAREWAMYATFNLPRPELDYEANRRLAEEGGELFSRAAFAIDQIAARVAELEDAFSGDTKSEGRAA